MGSSRNDPDVQAKWFQVRAKAIARDGGRCQVCGNTHPLEVHHYDNWKHFPTKRFLLSNLVTLCRPCHKQFHWWMGGSWRRCTRKHFDAWLRVRQSTVILRYLNLMLYSIITLMIIGVVSWILL